MYGDGDTLNLHVIKIDGDRWMCMAACMLHYYWYTIYIDNTLGVLHKCLNFKKKVWIVAGKFSTCGILDWIKIDIEFL